jgi:hypothetical protein
VKVYIATSGEYSDYRICHVFARQEDAEDYAGADDVIEYEVLDHPVEMRPLHGLMWSPEIPDREGTSLALANPYESSWPEDFDGDARRVTHTWHGPPQRTGPVLQVSGWDRDRVRKVYSEQRAQYLVRVAAGSQVPG